MNGWTGLQPQPEFSGGLPELDVIFREVAPGTRLEHAEYSFREIF